MREPSIPSPSRYQDGRTLALLAELERFYNGPIPADARRLAGRGSRALMLLVEARGEAAFFTAMARAQLRALRQRRDAGSCYPALSEDLAYYLRHRRAWRRTAIGLAAATAENEKPRHSAGGASIMMDHPSPDPGPGLVSALSI